ncbi:TIGR01906 family membrane protein [Chloroflexota bacterium]
MKILGICTKWLFILCLPVLLLTASIGWAVNSQWLYKYGFEKYNVSQTTGLAEVELEKAATGLISYFNSGEEYISLTVMKDGKPFELFNQREVAHLRDVKGLMRLDFYLLLGILIYALSYAGVSLCWRRRRHWRQLGRGVINGSGLTLALMLALGLGALFNFDQLFYQFHLISFTNELWQLDPGRDYLIMLFPGGFWYDAAIFCTLATAGLAIILGGVAGGYLLLTKSGRNAPCPCGSGEKYKKCHGA